MKHLISEVVRNIGASQSRLRITGGYLSFQTFTVMGMQNRCIGTSSGILAGTSI